MNKNAIRSGCFAVLLATAMHAGGAFLSDDFGTAHDYFADGAAGTIWDGFFYNFTNGNATVLAADADTSNAGRLTFRSTYGNWENGDDDGLLLYKTVTGDFDAQVQVISMNNVSWHDAGIMARVANLDDAGPGEDWVAVKHFAQGGRNGHRSVATNITSTVEVSGLQPWIRLKRTGNVFASYRSSDGMTWSQIGSTLRSDMAGLAVQVGIWQATFSANEGTAQFDNFSLRVATAWNLGTGGSWTNANNWTQGVPDGQTDWAMLSTNLLSSGSVTLDGSQTLGRLTFDNARPYSIDPGSSSPASTLTLDDSNDVSPSLPSLDVYVGSHAITAPVILSNGVTVTTASDTGLTVCKGFSGNGPLTKSGAGTLTLPHTNTYSGATQIQGGTLKLAPLPMGTQAYYAFDNPANLGQDGSVMGNDLSVGTGSPTYTNAGVFGGAVYLNGSSTFTRSVFPSGVPTGSSAYTIALWEKDNGSGDTGGFVGWGKNNKNECNNLRFNGSNGLINYWYGNDWILTGLSTNPKDGNWHHIAVTWDGATQTLYVDGGPVGTAPRTGLNAQATNFFVGKTTADIGFKGWMDNVLIANRALSASEIADLRMEVRSNNLLPADTSLQVATGAMLDLSGASQTVGTLSGSGRVMNSSGVGSTLTAGTDNASRTFSGTIDGPIKLAKAGTGSLTLSGINGYSGGTAVNEGTLVLSAPSIQSVLAGSVAWFDAAQADTFETNENGLVTLWKNKGTAGTTLDAIQITSGVGPTVLTNALNGRSVLSVDGTTALRTKNSLGISGAMDRTLFAVGNRKNNGTNFIAHVGEGLSNRCFGIASQPQRLFVYTWDNDILFDARPNGTYELYDFVIANGAASANVNSGGTVLSGAKTMAPNTTDTALYMGSRFSEVCWGNVAEVIVFNRALAPPEIMGVEAYLRSKWLTSGSSVVLSAGDVSVAAGAVLDLNGTTQTLARLSGCGLVTNGTLAVSGDIAPGGTNAVGTLTLASAVPLSGTLLTDVAPDGTCDNLKVQGPLDLTSLSLQIQDVSQLTPGMRYRVASCTPGGLTGPFTTVNLNANSWTVSYNNAAGEVRLISRGLLIMLH